MRAISFVAAALAAAQVSAEEYYKHAHHSEPHYTHEETPHYYSEYHHESYGHEEPIHHRDSYHHESYDHEQPHHYGDSYRESYGHEEPVHHRDSYHHESYGHEVDPYHHGRDYYHGREHHGYSNTEEVVAHHEVAAPHHEVVAPHHEAVKAHAFSGHHADSVHDEEHGYHDSYNIEHMDHVHHEAPHHETHHDLPLDSHHHAPEHIEMHHDSDHHDTHHEMEHGHHDTHYDSEHFYDSPYHHGGLHGEYDDPMAHEGHHSYYEDEEHVPHFTHHSEQPLTHTEEYYYGAPIHHYHHDYHHTDVSHSCWKKAYGRTAGEPLTSCPDNKEKDGALCYDMCKPGYTGVGPICWQNCPHDKGFRDDGAYCYKPDAYGRGAGQVHECGGCEKWGDFWHPKCHEDFHAVGCCVCSPNCPKDMTDIGVSCAKSSYNRGAGTQLICHKDQVQSGALCYTPCDHGANGVGPVCWGKCPAGTKVCGSLCLGPDEICSEYVANEVEIAYQLVVDSSEHTINGTVIDVAHIGSEVTFPNCPAW